MPTSSNERLWEPDLASMTGRGSPGNLPESLWGSIARGARDFGFFTEMALGFKPHPGQLLWGQQDADEAYLITGRRYGKSQGAVGKLVHRMFYQRGAIVLNCSITMDQSRIVFDRAVELVKGSRFLGPMVSHITYHPFPRLRLVNGSELWARSTQRRCQFIRGHAFDLINYDEIAYGMKSDLDVLLPCLVDRSGQFNGTSTPHGQNWVRFEVERLRGQMGRERAFLTNKGVEPGTILRGLRSFVHRGSTYENVYLPREAIDRIAARLPEMSRREEIEGEFVPASGTLFAYENVVAMECPDLELPYESEVELIPVPAPADGSEPTRGFTVATGGNETEPQAGGVYVFGGDVGRKKSWAAGFVMRIDCHPWRVVARFRAHRQPWDLITEGMAKLARHWRVNLMVVDSTGLGDVVVEMPAFRGMPVQGYNFGTGGPSETGSTRAKTDLLIAAQRCVQNRMAVLPFFAELHDQLLLYTWDEAEKSEDQTFDDLFGFALTLWAGLELTPGGVLAATGGRRQIAQLTSSSTRHSGY